MFLAQVKLMSFLCHNLEMFFQQSHFPRNTTHFIVGCTEFSHWRLEGKVFYSMQPDEIKKLFQNSLPVFQIINSARFSFIDCMILPQLMSKSLYIWELFTIIYWFFMFCQVWTWCLAKVKSLELQNVHQKQVVERLECCCRMSQEVYKRQGLFFCDTFS